MKKWNYSKLKVVIVILLTISIIGFIASLIAPILRGDFSANTFGEFVFGVIIMPFLMIFIYTFGLFMAVIDYEGSRGSWFSSGTGAFGLLFYLSIIGIIITLLIISKIKKSKAL